jgi:hypothetical protein
MLFTSRRIVAPLPVVLLLTFSCLTLFVHLGQTCFWGSAESRFAAGALEMGLRGDWLIPRMNGHQQSRELPLPYWLTLVSFQFLGVHEFAVRCWSAMASLATIGLTYLLARRQFDERVALWSGLILASSVGFLQQGRTANPATLLALSTTLAMYLIIRVQAGARSQSARKILGPSGGRVSWPQALLIHAVLSLATLAVGPLGMVLPLAAWWLFLILRHGMHPESGDPHAIEKAKMEVTPDMLLSSPSEPAGAKVHAPGEVLLKAGHRLEIIRETFWRMRPELALLVLVIVTGPWLLSIGWRTDGIGWPPQKAGNSPELASSHDRFADQVPASAIWSQGLVLVSGFYPWSILLGGLLFQCWRCGIARVRPDENQLLLLCWFGLEVTAALAGVWPSFDPAAPLGNPGACFVPLAIFSASLLSRHLGKRRLIDRVTRPDWIVLLVIGGALLLPGGPLTNHYLTVIESTFVKTLASFGIIVCGFWLATRVAQGDSIKRGADATGIWRGSAPSAWNARGVLAATLLFGLLVLRSERPPQTGELFSAIFARSPNPEVATYGPCDPSWIFYLRRPLGEIEVGSAAPTGESGFLPRRGSRPTLDEFLRDGTSRFVIARQRDLPEIGRTSSAAIDVIAEVPGSRSDERLMVLSLRDPQTTRRVFPAPTQRR